MSVKIYRKPEVENPVLVACWPGIGNIGVIAVDTLRGTVKAEEFGEIEPWDFFYPSKVVIRNGELKDLVFPQSKFYYAKTEKTDLIFFIGEEQPTEAGRTYAEGEKAYRMANLVLDVAVEFGCHRVYTSGAAVAPIHHTTRPKVWVVPNTENMVGELRTYRNTVLMSDIEGRRGQGSITGLNGLLLGVAKKRGLEAVCIMGEIPIYLQGFPFPYPQASKSVLEVLTSALHIETEMEGMDEMVARSETEIDRLYEHFPSEMREQLDRLKYVAHEEPAEPGPITEEDKQKILDDIDKFFKKEPRED
jgi:proteasome assembly chaperone (PAC2) family protein